MRRVHRPLPFKRVNAHQAAVDPHGELLAREGVVLVPVASVSEEQLRVRADEARLDAYVGHPPALGSCPPPHVAEHPAVQAHHESVLEHAIGSEGDGLPPGPCERLRDVLELDLIQVSARGHEIRDQPIEILLLDRGGARGLGADRANVELRRGAVLGRGAHWELPGGACSSRQSRPLPISSRA